jgi:hypothetical protein
MQSLADSKAAPDDTRVMNTTLQVGAEATHTLMRFVLWLLRGDADGHPRMPVRVFYKFDSGSWRCRSTRQLQKVYRCR